MDIKNSIVHIILKYSWLRLLKTVAFCCVLFSVSLCQTAFCAEIGVSNTFSTTFQHKKVAFAIPATDTNKNKSQHLVNKLDSIPDTLSVDSTLAKTKDTVSDTLAKKRKNYKGLRISPNAITDIVTYKAKDSVVFLLDDRKATLFKEGSIDYQDVNLVADSISVDFQTRMLNANGLTDTNGAIYGRPKFKDGSSEYNANEITYNFNSRKGIIQGVITQEGEGFLHGSKVKKMNDSVMYLNSGKFTTCNYAHPHFALEFSKSKLITKDKIVTGPAYMTVGDVPTPLALPFAFFPFTKGRTSGVLIPSYGWANNRGYYLRNGGYYLAINDYLDLTLVGDIYTNLSWAVNPKSNYYRKYKYRGAVDIRYEQTREGLEGTDTYNRYNDFKVAWTHQQDAKANPNSHFSANVNLVSRNYSKWTSNSADYFNSTTTSSIAYSTSIAGIFNFSANLGESYNINTRMIDLKLPSISLSSNQFHPFRRKNPQGSYKWYENITVSYSMNAVNSINTVDTLLFSKDVLQRMKNGISHSIPVSSSVKVFKYFTWTNSINYNARWHFNSIRKSYDADSGAVLTDTVWGFVTNRDVGFSSSLNTRLYGVFNFKKGFITALRHVINPSVSFNYRPDFGNPALGYWRTYIDGDGKEQRYSIFEQDVYGGPSYGRSGNIALSISNNLEMKVKSSKDTANGTKKIVLLENLSFSTSYDLAKDSVNWSPLSVSGRTTLFKNCVINYSASFIPYYINENNVVTNTFLWDKEKKLFQKQNSQWNMQLNWSLNQNTFKKGGGKSGGAPAAPVATNVQNPFNTPQGMGPIVDNSVPWNLSLAYTLSYINTYYAAKLGYESQVVQTLSLRGDVSLTKNWKISFTTGYDFQSKAMSYTSVDIHRDLHCWEMHFNWVPFGYYKSWNFTINVKAGMLQDLKYNKRNSYQDNQGYYHN